MSKSLNNIRCDVESCRFNRDAKLCTADEIRVSCTCASPDCCDETQCGTFEARE